MTPVLIVQKRLYSRSDFVQHLFRVEYQVKHMIDQALIGRSGGVDGFVGRQDMVQGMKDSCGTSKLVGKAMYLGGS